MQGLRDALKRISVWYNEEIDDMKDEKADQVKIEADRVTNRVNRLAAAYQAAGIVIKPVRK